MRAKNLFDWFILISIVFVLFLVLFLVGGAASWLLRYVVLGLHYVFIGLQTAFFWLSEYIFLPGLLVFLALALIFWLISLATDRGSKTGA